MILFGDHFYRNGGSREAHCLTFHTILMMRPGQVDSYVSCMTAVDREDWPLTRALGRAQTGFTRLGWALFAAPRVDLGTGRYIDRVGSGRPTRSCESTDYVHPTEPGL